MYTAEDVYGGIRNGGAPQICRNYPCLEMMHPCDWLWNDEAHTSVRAFYICTACGTPDVVAHWSVGFILDEW